ncbi:MAG: GntR family transcriptional regulator, partial [Armatimonadetes bacterium]|nr:GntR family transcriptional regulator [Armatimonadota bacterium]
MSGSLPTPVAKYRQLLALLRDEIRAGVYQPGQAFPSQNALSERYGVSVTTVREALSVLAHQGLITRING